MWASNDFSLDTGMWQISDGAEGHTFDTKGTQFAQTKDLSQYFL